MKTTIRAAILLLALMTGCATKTEKKIDNDIAKQPEVTSAQAAESGQVAITNSPKLSPEQKEKMLALMNRTKVEMAVIRKDEAQIKASLFKYLATGSYEDREIAAYKLKLLKMENKKMQLMFANIKETRKILGKEAQFNPDLLEFDRLNAEHNQL